MLTQCVSTPQMEYTHNKRQVKLINTDMFSYLSVVICTWAADVIVLWRSLFWRPTSSHSCITLRHGSGISL